MGGFLNWWRVRLHEFSRWRSLRSLGNSSAARYSIAVPLIGYFVLFNQQIVDWLHLDANLCATGCTASWRLRCLYFGGCAFAVASVIFACRCPSVVKLNGGASEFYNRDAGYYQDANHMRALYAQSAIEGVQSLYFDEGIVVTGGFADRIGEPDLSHALTSVYLASDIANARSRIVCLLLFALGFALVAIPTIITFGQVVLVTIQ